MKTILITLYAFLCFFLSIEVQADTIPKTVGSKLPVWKQIRQQYGLPITRQKSKDELRYSWKKDRKKHFALLLSLPYVNCYNLAPEGTTQRDNTFGFIGIGIGMEYYYKQNISLSLKWNATMTFLVPFPAPVDYESSYTNTQGMDLCLMQNHHIKFISIGYGICVARNSWNYYAEGYDDTEFSPNGDYGNLDLSYKRYSVGTPFHIYGYFGRVFGIGLNYRPTFYRLGSPDPWKYEHLISLDFQFRIML